MVEVESEWTVRRREKESLKGEREPTSAKTGQMWGTVGVKANAGHRRSKSGCGPPAITKVQ